MNLTPLIRKLHVVEKERSLLVPFPIDPPTDSDKDFAWAQRALIAEIERQYNSGLPVRVIVLKARQLGLSTISEAVMFLWAMLWDNMQGLVLAHENDTTQSLFEKTQLYYDTSPWKSIYNARHATQRRLVWDNGSSIRTATAGNPNAGVGRTIRALHTSEASRYPEPEQLMGALRQSLPKEHGTIEIVESTARGVGNWFHDEWRKAASGESNYAPLFFPWYKHYEYRVAPHLCQIQTAAELDEEETRLHNLGATFQHLQWRRDTIIDTLNYDEDLFRQEYPATPEEAFLSSGRNVFNQQLLLQAYQPLERVGIGGLYSRDGHDFPEFISSPGGKLKVYRAPVRARYDSRLYFIGVDPSRTTYGDPACIQVINRFTHEQVAVWHGNPTREDTANEIAREALKLGRWYHDAEILVEIGGGGHGVISLLLDWGYPNLWRHRQADRPADTKPHPSYGFLSNHDRKSWAVECMKYLLAKGFITFHDDATFDQLQKYTFLTEWEMGAAEGHDDAAMALILACYGDQTEPAYTPPEYRYGGNDSMEVFAQQGH